MYLLMLAFFEQALGTLTACQIYSLKQDVKSHQRTRTTGIYENAV